MLSYSEIGPAPIPQNPALLIVHGLFGSGRNWGVIAKRLSDTRRVVTVDMRNHGQSPHLPGHSYPEMADDLAEVITHLGGPVDICAHSMGGKAAMALALTRAALIRKLLIADIAPVSYGHAADQIANISAMRAVDLANLTRRAEANTQLAALGLPEELCQFFTQSLDLKNKRWLLNLDALEAEMSKIIGWPEDLTGPFTGPTFFLSGASSDYITAEHRPAIKQLFPKARFAKIPNAGHWLHAENPRAFEATLRAFFDA